MLLHQWIYILTVDSKLSLLKWRKPLLKAIQPNESETKSKHYLERWILSVPGSLYLYSVFGVLLHSYLIFLRKGWCCCAYVHSKLINGTPYRKRTTRPFNWICFQIYLEFECKCRLPEYCFRCYIGKEMYWKM